jgi:IS1 family transposase
MFFFHFFSRELRDPQFLPERLSAKAAKDTFEKFQKIEKDYNHQFSGKTCLLSPRQRLSMYQVWSKFIEGC